MEDLANMLEGGDRRSLGRSQEVIKLINSQDAFDQLFRLIYHHDHIILMRAADVLEKISAITPAFLQSHKQQILKLCQQHITAELKWHMALIIPRLQLSDDELGKCWQILSNWATSKKEGRITRVNALQGLYDLLKQEPMLANDLAQTISEVARENIPSINARIKKFKI